MLLQSPHMANVLFNQNDNQIVHGPKEIDGLFVLPGKAYTLLTDQLITGIPLWFEPAQEKWFKSNHPYI